MRRYKLKSKLSKFLLLFISFFFFILSANALVNSSSDINAKIIKLNKIAQYDYNSFVNKNELIGYRLSNFNMLTSQYQNSAKQSVDNLNNIVFQIDTIRNSSDFSDSDKELQINKLYQDADTTLYNFDSQTLNYIFSLRNVMPSISYQRFAKKFQEFYNEIQLTDNKLSIK